MKVPRQLLTRIIRRTITPTEVIAEVRAMAPVSARMNRQHSWWAVFGEEILDVVIRASTGTVFLSAAEAVAEAQRTSGRVVAEKIAGVVLFRVLPVAEAEVAVTERIVAQAMPTEVEPAWDDELPTLDTFRRLAERQYLQRLLAKNKFNISASAIEAGIARQTLHGLIQRQELKRPTSTAVKADHDVAHATSSPVEPEVLRVAV